MRVVKDSPLSQPAPNVLTADSASHAAKLQAKLMRKLKKIGITQATKISNSLQGSIWRTSQNPWSINDENNDSNDSDRISSSVVKITSRMLHHNSIGMIRGETFTVAEDILVEQSILKYLTQQQQCPQSIVAFRHFFETQSDYYLIMEDGGVCMFDFTKDVHRLIRKKEIALVEWQKVVRVIFKQMVEAVAYMHSKNVVHFDISLENYLVNDIDINLMTNVQTQESKLLFDPHDLKIKLCDFGLSELFTSSECLSSKYSGKKQYKSPEVIVGKHNYDAKSNDIWCLGVCLFMVATGCPPWDVAWRADKTFRYVMKKGITCLLKAWKLDHKVEPGLMDILERIFQNEERRITIEQIKMHSYTINAFEFAAQS